MALYSYGFTIHVLRNLLTDKCDPTSALYPPSWPGRVVRWKSLLSDPLEKARCKTENTKIENVFKLARVNTLVDV